ncbi:lipocalin-like domain-containing protein [Herbaspirillum seropedicae]|uniref:lipocalin-like domain-containing protein n=1 Tax=Herbaspirillum seropedicae TaxID=964 RepID=UPI001123DB92|nr:lipocalin-like domain-containing protein [Herbaspirillum seropedicae]QDD63759.1 lipocalin-like domain-containing protein [Herbaspirillum seropedicae]
MNRSQHLGHRMARTVVLLGLLSALAEAAHAAPINPAMAGTWSLAAADVIHPDGSQARDYGQAPKGMLVIDPQGRYSLQIFKAERPRFASPDKGAATPDEYRSAVMGSSTHFGTLSVDPAGQTLVFHIDGASFPNWEGQEQKRSFELKGDELIYRVVPRPNGDVPVSVWRRMN